MECTNDPKKSANVQSRVTTPSAARRRRKPLPGGVDDGEGLKLTRSITVGLRPGTVYQFWRNLENLPRFMYHVKSVTDKGGGISRWCIETGKNNVIEWDAQIIEDKPDEMISWKTLEGGDVDHAGSVWFTPAPGDRGTVIKVAMKYSAKGGKLGAFIARLRGENADRQIAEDLFRLKSLLETGESPNTHGQPNGGNAD